MVRAVQIEAWNHTAVLCAHLANIHRGKIQAPYKPEQFHPLHQSQQRQANILTREAVRERAMAWLAEQAAKQPGAT